MSEKIKNLLKSFGWEIGFGVISFIMMFVAFLIEYFFYPDNTEFWASFFALLSFIGIIGLTIRIIWRQFKENKQLMLFTILILFSIAIFNSTQISAIIFPIVFELIGKVLFSNSSLKGLEKKIQKFNSDGNNIVKLKVDKNYFEEREMSVEKLFKIMVYFIWLLPVLVYDVIISLASHITCINEEAFESLKNGEIHVGNLTTEQFEISVNKITASNCFNEKIFVFANNLLMKYDKLMLCTTFMVIFMIIFFIFLFFSERVKDMSDEYVKRKNRPFIKNEVKGKEKWRSFFTDDEIVYIDEA